MHPVSGSLVSVNNLAAEATTSCRVYRGHYRSAMPLFAPPHQPAWPPTSCLGGGLIVLATVHPLLDHLAPLKVSARVSGNCLKSERKKKKRGRWYHSLVFLSLFSRMSSDGGCGVRSSLTPLRAVAVPLISTDVDKHDRWKSIHPDSSLFSLSLSKTTGRYKKCEP